MQFSNKMIRPNALEYAFTGPRSNSYPLSFKATNETLTSVLSVFTDLIACIWSVTAQIALHCLDSLQMILNDF